MAPGLVNTCCLAVLRSVTVSFVLFCVRIVLYARPSSPKASIISLHFFSILAWMNALDLASGSSMLGTDTALGVASAPTGGMAASCELRCVAGCVLHRGSGGGTI
jgi:hypothetical protein